MADGDAQIKGVNQVIKNLSSYKTNMVSEIVNACEAVQQQVVTDAKAIVPVITGNLQGSIMPSGIIITNDNVQAMIAANANYASYVEGVADAQGRMGRGRKTPFLGPALLQNQPVFVRAIAAAAARART